MKASIVCLLLLAALVALALWQQHIITNLADRTEEVLRLALQLAERDELPNAQGPLREIVQAWDDKKFLLYMLSDHSKESEIRTSLLKLAAYAEQNDKPLFYGEAAYLDVLLDDLRDMDRPTIHNIL